MQRKAVSLPGCIGLRTNHFLSRFLLINQPGHYRIVPRFPLLYRVRLDVP